jgi:hypothetical protein
VTSLALLGSPFLGPEVWTPVAHRLSDAGHEVTVAAGRGDSPEEVARSFAGALPGDDRLVLVPHSNAGLYAAGLIASRPSAAWSSSTPAIPARGAPPRSLLRSWSTS